MVGGQSPISDDTEKSVVKDGAEPEEERGNEDGEKGHLATWNSLKKGSIERTEKEDRGEEMAPLHTKSLLTFGVSFLHADFVPHLVKKMPSLEHISIIIRVRQSFTLSCV